MQTPDEHPFDLNSPFLKQPMNSCQVYLVNLKEKEIVSHQPFNIHTKKPTVHETRKHIAKKLNTMVYSIDDPCYIFSSCLATIPSRTNSLGMKAWVNPSNCSPITIPILRLPSAYQIKPRASERVVTLLTNALAFSEL